MADQAKEFRRYCDDGQRTFAWDAGGGDALTLVAQWKGFSAKNG